MTEKTQLIAKLTDLERFCLIGYIHTNDALNAYIGSRGRKLTATPKSLTVQASRWINSDECKAFLEVERARLHTATSIDTLDVENRDKDSVIRELNVLATSATDPKVKAELLMKLADLQQMKKTEETTEENKVRYYMPLKCNNCVLYKDAKAKNEQKNK